MTHPQPGATSVLSSASSASSASPLPKSMIINDEAPLIDGLAARALAVLEQVVPTTKSSTPKEQSKEQREERNNASREDLLPFERRVMLSVASVSVAEMLKQYSAPSTQSTKTAAKPTKPSSAVSLTAKSSCASSSSRGASSVNENAGSKRKSSASQSASKVKAIGRSNGKDEERIASFKDSFATMETSNLSFSPMYAPGSKSEIILEAASPTSGDAVARDLDARDAWLRSNLQVLKTPDGDIDEMEIEGSKKKKKRRRIDEEEYVEVTSKPGRTKASEKQPSNQSKGDRKRAKAVVHKGPAFECELFTPLSTPSRLTPVTDSLLPELPEREMENILRKIANSVEAVRRILFPQMLSLSDPRPKPSETLMASYWNACVLTLKSRKENSYATILEDAFLKHAQGILGKAELMLLVCYCMAGEDRLILGLDMLLPSGFSMAPLLVHSKLVVALACHFNKTVVSNKQQQRAIIRRGLRELYSVLKAPRMDVRPFVIAEVMNENGVAVQSVSAIEDDPYQALVDWMDSLVDQYWGTTQQANAEKCLHELSTLNVSNDYDKLFKVLTKAQEFIPEGELKSELGAITKAMLQLIGKNQDDHGPEDANATA